MLFWLIGGARRRGRPRHAMPLNAIPRPASVASTNTVTAAVQSEARRRAVPVGAALPLSPERSEGGLRERSEHKKGRGWAARQGGGASSPRRAMPTRPRDRSPPSVSEGGLNLNKGARGQGARPVGRAAWHRARPLSRPPTVEPGGMPIGLPEGSTVD